MAGKAIEIFGVAEDTGGGSGASPYWRSVQFSKWRPLGDEICHTPLYVQEPCKEADIRPWMKSIKAGTMLHMEIRFTKQMVPEQLRGKVIRYFGKTRADKELLKAAADKRPGKIDISGFATFKLDPRHDCYTAILLFAKSRVAVEIHSDRKRTIESICEQIQQSGFLKPDNQVRMLDVLQRDLIPLKNEDWLKQDERAVKPSAFRKALKITAIEIAASGTYECIWNDGGMFDGHDVVVRGSLKNGPGNADLHG